MDTKKEDDSQYAQLGVDSGKSNVRSIFKSIINNEYPDAFVNIITAPYTNGKIAMTQHQDGDGSKMIARLLYFLETGDDEQIGYAVDDAFTMNTSDVSAAGFVKGAWVVTQVLNSGLPKELKEVIMISLANRWSKLKELYQQHGFNDISFLGGETADLLDQVRSTVFDMTITAYAEKSHIIKGNVQPGDKIWGFASDGQAVWEKEKNSGIMANGLTLARSCLFWKGYDKQYPILKRDGPYYTGRLKVMDTPKLLSGSTISDAILSPTRQWPIVIRKIMDKLIADNSLELLHGISINTGGGTTKVKNLGHGILYSKTMPRPAPIFQLISNESKEKWENMFKTFNCGVGIDVVGEDDGYLKAVLYEVAEECGIKLYELGNCLKNEKSEKENVVLLRTQYGSFWY
jgi:phosphoribosylaminoimidazole (AIR) synthetase